MNARSRRVLLVVTFLALAASGPAHATVFSINFHLAFDQLDFGGSSTGADAPALGAGRTPVDSDLQAHLSSVAPSTLAGTLAFDDLFNATMSLTGTFYLDLTFTPTNAGDSYDSSLTTPLLVAASAANPLVVTMDFGVTIGQLDYIQQYLTDNPGATIGDAVDDFNANNDPLVSGVPDIAPIITDPGVKIPLNADLDGAGGDDAVQYFGQSLLLTAADAVNVDVNTASVDFLDAVTQFSLGNDVNLDIAGSIDVSATGQTFHGGVVDLTDPPFSFIDVDLVMRASSPLAQVPEPFSVGLLLLGIAGIAGLCRRASSRG